MSGNAAIAELNREGALLAESFPPACTELLDFHFKHRFDKYVSAIQRAPGRKLVLHEESSASIRQHLPLALILADTVVFNCASYSVPPGISFFPISDELASPVLGLLSVREPGSKAERPPKPGEVAYIAALLAERAVQSGVPDEILGVEWATGRTGWQRSVFTRTMEPYRNHRNEDCHIAAGFVHFAAPKGDTLFQELEPFLLTGRVTVAPFLRLSPGDGSEGEAVMKSSILNSSYLASADGLGGNPDALPPLCELAIPYLNGVPLPLLAEILNDEPEATEAFRRTFDRLAEDLEGVEDPRELRQHILRFKRDQLEDELARVQETWQRVSRMSALTRIGAYLTTGVVGVAAILGLGAPEIVCSVGGVATATVAELFRAHEEKRQVRKSPMHLIWRVREGAG